jgi:hypothetical protein
MNALTQSSRKAWADYLDTTDDALANLQANTDTTPDNARLGIMRPAGSLRYPAFFIKLVEAGVPIGLQYPTEIAQVPLRMIALSIR